MQRMYADFEIFTCIVLSAKIRLNPAYSHPIAVDFI